jgi:zinc transport system substrate-binding protein
MRRSRLAALCGVAVILSACGKAPQQVQEKSNRVPEIYTVNYPLTFFAETLAGNGATIRFPAPAGVDPAHWQPSVDIVLAYQRADLILLNGADYARWVRQTSLPLQSLVDTGAAYSNDLIHQNAGPAHSHGQDGANSHGDLAFTTWLDLTLAQHQVAAIAVAMQSLMPADRDTIAKRAAHLHADLAAIDHALSRVTRQLDGVPILYSHPVYQYLERRYGLTGRAVHWEPDVMPEPDQWQLLADVVTDHPARLMLWEGEPLPEIRERLSGMGIRVVVYRAMGNRPAQGDFSSSMRANVDALAQALLPNPSMRVAQP